MIPFKDIFQYFAIKNAKVVSPPETVIVIEFSVLDIEASPNCSYDRLVIKEEVNFVMIFKPLVLVMLIFLNALFFHVPYLL